MKFKLATAALLSASMFIAATAQAEVTTVGALTLGDSSDTYVTDSLNGLEWLRWTPVKNLTISEIETQINGGLYSGWSIANYTQSALFVDAVYFGGPSDTCSNGNNYCGVMNLNGLRNMMGFVTPSHNNQHNYGFFIDDDGVDIGTMADNTGNTSIYHTAPYITDMSLVPYGSFMLVRSSSIADVAAPGAFAALALGLMGFASRRFKK
jgi:hypothetical protein